MKKRINLDYQLFLQREEHIFHQPYSNEINFYTAIKTGDIDFIEESKKKYGKQENKKSASSGKGLLSKDPVKNERYHSIVNAAIITRNCIEGGLAQEDAYTLSDLYIRLADETDTVAGLQEINDEMVQSFTLKMKELHTQQIMSRHISQCIHYIYDHLHEQITIDTLSQQVMLHPCYLATLFKKETGTTIHSFIQNKRLETAKNILKNSSYSCADIANTLCFSSQSHFIRVFRKKYGMTPKEYRQKKGMPTHPLEKI